MNMKKFFLICGFATIMLQSIWAQEKNYRDEYIYETVEVEVGDTAKAMLQAKDRSWVENEQNLRANAFRLEMVNIIDSLISNKVKKVKDEKALQIVINAYEYNKWLHVSKDEKEAATKGKLRVGAYKMLSDYKNYQLEEYVKNTTRLEYDWRKFLTFHKETRTVKKKNPNYRKDNSDIDSE